jgi:hypothetical protein
MLRREAQEMVKAAIRGRLRGRWFGVENGGNSF